MSTDALATSPRRARARPSAAATSGCSAGSPRVSASTWACDVLYVRGGVPDLRDASAASGSRRTPALWLVLPTDSHLEQTSPGLEAATRQGKRPRSQPAPARGRRPAGRARPRSASASWCWRSSVARRLGGVLAAAARRGRAGRAVAAGRRGAARALGGQLRPDRLRPGRGRQRRRRRPTPGSRPASACWSRRWCCSRCRPDGSPASSGSPATW